MIKTQVLKHFPGARWSGRGESKGDVGGGATARGAMERSRYVRVIVGEEVRTNDSIEYFLPTGIGSTSCIPKR